MWLSGGVLSAPGVGVGGGLSCVRYDRCLFRKASSGTPLGANLPTVSGGMMETTAQADKTPGDPSCVSLSHSA